MEVKLLGMEKPQITTQNVIDILVSWGLVEPYTLLDFLAANRAARKDAERCMRDQEDKPDPSD